MMAISPVCAPAKSVAMKSFCLRNHTWFSFFSPDLRSLAHTHADSQESGWSKLCPLYLFRGSLTSVPRVIGNIGGWVLNLGWWYNKEEYALHRHTTQIQRRFMMGLPISEWNKTLEILDFEVHKLCRTLHRPVWSKERFSKFIFVRLTVWLHSLCFNSATEFASWV